MGIGEMGEGKIRVPSQGKVLVLAKVLGFVYGVVGETPPLTEKGFLVFVV